MGRFINFFQQFTFFTFNSHILISIHILYIFHFQLDKEDELIFVFTHDIKENVVVFN